MIFKDEQHENFYNKTIRLTSSFRDSERKALFYTLGITHETINHINELYDFSENCIKLEGLKTPWQTGTSKRICRLAFNLYNGTCEDSEYGQAWLYTPYALFDSSMYSLVPYMLEAVRIRLLANEIPNLKE